MPQLDTAKNNTGVKFKIFPQPRFLNWEPEVVTLSVSTNDILPGPSDNKMFVTDAINKSNYTATSKPQYAGNFNQPVLAGEDGNFLHLDIDSREFSCASMYASVRRVIDIWEDYFQDTIHWHFETDYDRLELIPLIEWDNAHSGYGFIEFGFQKNEDGLLDTKRPYCENFDVLAHEVGHSIIYSKVGVPSSSTPPKIDYSAMHESSADLVAVISSLHFNSVVDRLLKKTQGNLFTINELDRIGELSESTQMRTVFNSFRMSDPEITLEAHSRAQPLTGGIFDIMVEVFQKKLVAASLITPELAEASTQGLTPINVDLRKVQSDFTNAYQGNEEGFKNALIEARDYLGKLLALTWVKLNPDDITFHNILRQLMKSDREMEESKGTYQQTIRECFAWREIKVPADSLLMEIHAFHEEAEVLHARKQSKEERTLDDLIRLSGLIV